MQPNQFGMLHFSALLCFFCGKPRVCLRIAGDAAVEEFSGLALLVVGTRSVKQSPIVENDEVADLPRVLVDPGRLASEGLEVV